MPQSFASTRFGKIFLGAVALVFFFVTFWLLGTAVYAAVRITFLKPRSVPEADLRRKAEKSQAEFNKSWSEGRTTAGIANDAVATSLEGGTNLKEELGRFFQEWNRIIWLQKAKL